MLSKLFQESLESLSPPLHQCLHTSVHHSQSPIDTFIDLRSVSSNSFSLSLHYFDVDWLAFEPGLLLLILQCVLRLTKNLEKSLGEGDSGESVFGA